MKVDWKTCFRLGVTGFLLFLCVHYWEAVFGLTCSLFGAAQSLLIGCAMAYLLNILMSFYERHYFPKNQTPACIKSRRPVCMLAAMVTLVALVVLMICLVLPELLACVRLLMAEVPLALETAITWIMEQDFLTPSLEKELFASLQGINWQEKVAQMAQILLEGVGGAAQMAVATVSSLLSLIMTLVISLIFSIYVLSGKEQLACQFDRLFRRYLPKSWDHTLRYVLSTLNTCFHRFIVGQCTEAVILGLLCMAGMLLFQFPYAVMVGTLVGFTALIPVAGAYIGAGVGAFMIFTVSPPKAIAFLLYIVVLQQLEGNLVYPKVVGSSIGLPGIWVLATVTIAGGLFGIPGMLIGVPAAATIYQLLRKDIMKRNPPIQTKEE